MISKYQLRGRLLGLTTAAIVLIAITAICSFLWFRHSIPLLEITKDRFSFPLVLALLVLLYLLLITARAAHEPQYSMFLMGRAQELIFLRQWDLLIAPLVVLASLAVGYFKEPWQLPLSIVGWIAALYAVYGFVKDITGAWLRPVDRESHFLLESTPNVVKESNLCGEDPPEAFRLLAQHWKGRTLYVSTKPADWKLIEDFLICDQVNLALQDPDSNLSQRKVSHRSKPYQLPRNLNQYRETALIHTRAKGGLLHNEKKIRLCTDLVKLLDPNNTEPVVVQKTSYYLGICSNELTRFEITARDVTPPVSNDLFSFVRKNNGGVIGLDRSELSNHMGGGTVAITANGKVLISKQGRLNVISPGRLAPSGSGSFDWKDKQVASKDFSNLIRTGLERELMEECSFSPSDLAKTIILGMGRDLARGGKPEFFGVTLLARNEETVHPTISRAEVGFVDLHHDDIDLFTSNTKDLQNKLDDWLEDNRQRCSTALIVNLKLLRDASPQVHAEIFSHVKD